MTLWGMPSCQNKNLDKFWYSEATVQLGVQLLRFQMHNEDLYKEIDYATRFTGG